MNRTNKRSARLATIAAAILMAQSTYAQYLQLNLTGFQDGMGRYTDPKLNGWGMVQMPEGPFCVAELTPHHLAANAPGEGPLANPWAFAIAPAHFGKFSHALLIGNVEGPGYINAFDPNTGAFLGQLTNPEGEIIAIPGLWETAVSQDNPGNGKSNPLFFDAGPNAISFSGNGKFGMILPDPD